MMTYSHPFTASDPEGAHRVLTEAGWKIVNRAEGVALYEKDGKRIQVQQDAHGNAFWTTGKVNNRGARSLKEFFRSPKAYDAWCNGAKAYANYEKTAKDDPIVEPESIHYVKNMDMDMNAMSAQPVPDSSTQQDAPPTVGLGNCDKHNMPNCKECGCGSSMEHSPQSKQLHDVKKMFANKTVKLGEAGHGTTIPNCMKDAKLGEPGYGTTIAEPKPLHEMTNTRVGDLSTKPMIGASDKKKYVMPNKVLTAKARARLPKKAFALPGGRYPIHDASHARNALARVSQYGSPAEKAKVRAAVHKKYPGIGNRLINRIVDRICNAGNSAGVKKSWEHRKRGRMGVGNHVKGRAMQDLQEHLYEHGFTPLKKGHHIMHVVPTEASGHKLKHHAHEAHSAIMRHPDFDSHGKMDILHHHKYSEIGAYHIPTGKTYGVRVYHSKDMANRTDAFFNDEKAYKTAKDVIDEDGDNDSRGHRGQDGQREDYSDATNNAHSWLDFSQYKHGHCDKCAGSGDCAHCHGTGKHGNDKCRMCLGTGDCGFCSMPNRAFDPINQFVGVRGLPIVIGNREGDIFTMPKDNWYHIVPKGEFTHKPTGLMQVLDDSAVNSIINRFNEEAKDKNFPGILVDYDHFSQDTDKPSEAAGWITALDNRSDGVWAQIRWSTKGAEAVKGGMYRLVSPVWKRMDCDTLDNGRVRPLRLDSVALTNDPNLKGLVPLSNRSGVGTQDAELDYKLELTSMLGLKDSATDDEIKDALDERQHSTRKPAKKVKNRNMEDIELTQSEVDEILANRESEFATEKEALENRISELQASYTKLLNSLVESDLNEFASVISDKDAAKEMLLQNRENALKVLRGMKEKQGKTASTPNKPLHNRDDASLPSGEGSDTTMAKRVSNRAKEIMANRAKGGRPVAWTTAFNMAKGELVETE